MTEYVGDLIIVRALVEMILMAGRLVLCRSVVVVGEW